MLPRQSTEDDKALGAACLACGPALVAYSFAGILFVAGGGARLWLGLGTLALLALPLVAWFPATAARLRSMADGRIQSIPSGTWLWSCAIVGFLGLVSVFSLLIPLTQNDPLEYATAARTLCNAARLDVYPIVDGAASGGFYAPWTHPPGYPLLIAWSMLFDGCDTQGLSLKVPALYSTLCICFALFIALPRLAGICAVTLLVGTPILVAGTLHAAIDPIRLAPAVGSLFLVSLAIKNDSKSAWVGTGAALGLSLFIHSLGAITILLTWVGAVAGFGRRGLAKRFVWASIAGAIGLLIVAPFLVRNIALFGVPLGDSTAVWELPAVGHDSHLRESRGLATVPDQLVLGVLKGWTSVFFGASWWLLLMAIVLLALTRALRSTDADAGEAVPIVTRIALVQILAFLLLAIASLLVNSVALLKNERYFLTVQPAVAVLFGLLIETWSARLRSVGIEQSPLAVLGKWGVRLGMFASVALTIVYLGWWITARFGPGEIGVGPVKPRLLESRLLEFKHIEIIDRALRDGGCVLLFNQAEYGFYGSRCFVSYLDHRLLSAYRAAQGAAALQELRKLNVRLIYLPRHPMPEAENTALQEVLGSPAFSKVIWQNAGYRIFELAQAGKSFEFSEEMVVPRETVRASTVKRSWSTNPSRPLSARRSICADLRGLPPRGDGKMAGHSLLVRARIEGQGLLTLGVSVTYKGESGTTAGEDAVAVWEGVVRGGRMIQGQIALKGDPDALNICLAGPDDRKFALAGFDFSLIGRRGH